MRFANRQRRSLKTQIPAYMSVEASFVVPTAILIIAFIIYLAFFMYARCILSQDLYLIGFRASAYYEDQGYNSAADYAEDRKTAQFKNKYFGSSIPETKVTTKGRDIFIEGKITTGHRALGSYFKKLEDKWEFTQKARIRDTDPREKLRKLKRLKDIAELAGKRK
ncbi:hypothetical protein [Butyrivibrio sp. NC2002]|uniref:hypothetical protein n=1 Tax=Butyrivibrio sp. NC2002 TaxID=1410610 RepID=UPI0005675418|nr:hypothetical protein [Butyrivibrio sp. NC2002]